MRARPLEVAVLLAAAALVLLLVLPRLFALVS